MEGTSLLKLYEVFSIMISAHQILITPFAGMIIYTYV